MDNDAEEKLTIWGIFFGIIAVWIGIFFGTRAIGGNMIALCVAIFLFLLITIGSACFCVKAKKEMYKVRNPGLHKKLHSLMDSFDKLCTKHDVGYWITAGTLLGAVRHQGIIPWDDDLDISMTQEQYDKLRVKMVIEDMKRTGYMIKTTPGGFTKFGKIREQGTKHGFATWVDIFVMRLNQDKYEFRSANHRKSWPRMWYHKSEVERLKRYKFGKLMLPCPPKPSSFLKRAYGRNWMTPKITKEHLGGFYEKLRLFYIGLGLL